jgi:hypothetical protein
MAFSKSAMALWEARSFALAGARFTAGLFTGFFLFAERVAMRGPYLLGSVGLEIESYKEAFGVGKIADDFLNGDGDFSNERRECENLVTLGKLGVFYQVDHFDGVSSLEVFLAHPFEVGEGGEGFGGLPGDVKAEVPVAGFRLRCRCRPG